MRRLLPLLALAAIAGCSTRERANPFDPNNPNTSGRPFGFEAIAGDNQVQLRWQTVSATNLIGYQLYRRAPNETNYHPYGPQLNVGVNQFLDTSVGNFEDYAYRLYFVFSSGLGSRPAEDIATPGDVVPWVVESSGTDALKIAADGRHVAVRINGFGGTGDIAVNTANGEVWVSDPGASRVVVVHPLSGVRTVIPVAEPGAIAVDPFDGTAWVCDLGDNVVHHYRPQGDPESFDLPNLATPIDVAVDIDDGSVWVCERGANRVSRYPSHDTNPILQRTVPAPSRVAVDTVSRTAWVTSFTRGTVTRIDLGGAILDTLDLFVTPLGIAVDSFRGRIWVADPGAGEILALRRDGTVEFRLTGFPDAGELSVDVRTGECWAVLADPGELVRIAPTGAVRRRLGGFTVPIAVSVDPGR